MADLLWPADLAPYRVAFYLQPHVGGHQSPLTRSAKRYGLGKPMWIARLTFRGGYDGDPMDDAGGFGPRIDAILAEKEGLGRFLLWDFRRPGSIKPRAMSGAPVVLAGNAPQGATLMHVAGFEPGSVAFSVGDYVGGDGRCHIVTGDRVIANRSGVAAVSFRPPLEAALVAGSAIPIEHVTSPFILSDDTLDDAGQNETEVGQLSEYALSFMEDLA